ncbi:PRC-barrel domain-containing protein [Variovorax sp. J22R133]|uniref:PRC-barrel domain-containing protein n=1 Tax=Variovorax brevis TaxID=3053503 RepID=UPI00257521F3|nr:PRC-barrel domain-containing protein [Variovorax sp. J22R133]MDM0116660.1 PRC-barrel domain-containing protein [Variovorax sp. J22R133]
MRNTFTGALATLVLLMGAAGAQAQVAGSTLVGTSVTQVREIANGLSVKKQILGQEVLNENGETVGRITDVIVAPNASVSYAIVGAGGFLGVRRHDVAIPVALFNVSGDRPVLRGATRDAIKAMPVFEYTR